MEKENQNLNLPTITTNKKRSRYNADFNELDQRLR